MRSAFRHTWFLALAVIATLCLVAFWVLLGTNYSPEVYWALPALPGNLEIVCMLVFTVATVLMLLSSARRPDKCRRWFNAGLVSAAAASFILAKRALGFRPHCLDPILFCTACGWTIALWLRGRPVSSPGRSWHVQFAGFSYDFEPASLLPMAVVSAAVGLSVYYLVQQIRYFNNFQLGYADCGDYARTMFNTLYNPRELFLRVNPDRPLFYDHFQPGFLPFVPLWFLWPDLKATILLQILAVMACALPIYWIGHKLLQDKTAALLLVATWIVFPSASQLIYSGSYGFHCGNLCLPLYFLALAFWLAERPGWALLFAVWAILLKEEAAIPIGTFGLYLALFGNRRKLGIVIATVAFAYFLIMTSMVIPAMGHQAYMAQSHFAPIGETKEEILLSPWNNPKEFWGNLFSASSFYFAALLLAPLLFVPLKKPSVLLVGSLVFLFDCLDPTLKSIRYWYQLALFPVLFWALAAALSRATPARQRAVLSGATVTGILLSVFFGNVFWSKPAMVALPTSPDRPQIVQRMAQRIDRQGSLFATQRVAAHFITQKYLYVTPPLPPQIDGVLLDMRDSWRTATTLNWLKNLRDIQRQAESLPQLHLVDVQDGVLLYSRHGEPIDPRRLVERDALPPEAVHQPADLGKGVTFEGYTATAVTSGGASPLDQILITMFSSVAAPVDVDLAVRCHVQSQAGNRFPQFGSQFQPLGQCVWPVKHWVPGKFYADDFVIDLPAGLAAAGLSISFECQPL
ncbi:MAG: DUF2079 domain-containing protein [Verrucomicrobiia bacterium]